MNELPSWYDDWRTDCLSVWDDMPSCEKCEKDVSADDLVNAYADFYYCAECAQELEEVE